MERERFLGAGHYERTPERRGYANGAKPKKLDTPAGIVTLWIPMPLADFCSLKVSDIDSERMVIRVEQGTRAVRASTFAISSALATNAASNCVRDAMISASFAASESWPRSGSGGA